MTFLKRRIDLCLADIVLSATCSEDLLMEDVGPLYRDFCYSGKGCERIDLITRSGLPAGWRPEYFEKLFDTGQSWSLFRRGASHYLVITRAAADDNAPPACIAAFQGGINEVSVFFNYISAEKNTAAGPLTVPSPFYYPLDRLLMMFILSERSGVMLHAAGSQSGGCGFVFAGRSGAGKSTLARQLALHNGPVVLSDERIIARKVGGKFRIFGTPWPGDAGIAENKSSPLSTIFFIKHGSSNEIDRLSPREALMRLLPVSTIPWYHPESMTRVLSFCEELVSAVPSYELRFTLGGGAADVLDKFAASP